MLPLALIALVLQAGYLIAIKELGPDRMPPSRKRIRVATGWISMFTIPLSAYGFGIASPSNAGIFTVVWLMVIGLISAIIFLAVLDSINTMRLHRKEGDQLHRELRNNLQRDLKTVRDQRDRGES